MKIKNSKSKGLSLLTGGKKHKKRLSTKEELDVYWWKYRGNIKDPKSLIRIVARIEYPPIRKKALIEFLTRNNTNFAHFYDMLNAARDMLENNEKLGQKFFDKLFAISDADNLIELAEINIPQAHTRLLGKIDSGCWSNTKNLQMLIRYFEKRTDPKERAVLWKKIKRFDPSADDLRYLRDLPMMYALPKITAGIDKMLRNQHIEKETKMIKKIKDFIRQMEQKQK